MNAFGSRALLLVGCLCAACDQPDTGRMEGQDEGRQPVPYGANQPAPSAAVGPALDPTRAGSPVADRFVATLHGTDPGSPIRGRLELRQAAEGVTVTGEVTGLPPGAWRYHLGTSADCGAAGPPLAPGGRLDALVGAARVRDVVHLSSFADVAGRSVVVTADEGAGAPVACGVFGVAGPDDRDLSH